MTLDLPTLYVVAGLTILAVTAMFMVNVMRRGATPVDRIWTLALSCALGTALSYAAADTAAQLWWLVALGNGASALTTFAMWSGMRAYNGRRPLLGLGGGVAGLCVLATAVQGPDGGAWAGGGVMMAATGAGALLAAVASARERMRHVPSAGVLTAVLAVIGLYQGARLLLYLARGPMSREFDTYVGTELTTLLEVLLVLVAAIVMITARGELMRERALAHQQFDPMTGARTAVAFRQRATALLAEARRESQPAVLVHVLVQDVPQLVAAVGREYADDALVTVGERCLEVAPPPHRVVGRVGPESPSFDVLLVGTTAAEASTWAEALRKRIIASSLPVPGGHLRLSVSIGVAGVPAAAGTVEELCRDAQRSAQEALAAGGNRVLTGAASRPGTSS